MLFYKKGGEIKEQIFDIDGQRIPFFGNIQSTTNNKFNRVAIIASRYSKIKQDMYNIIRQNPEFPTNTEFNCAVAVLLILKTGIRIGNEDSAEGYMTTPYEGSKMKPKFVKTYGLTTMLPEHVTVKNGIVHLNFLGKKHVENSFVLDPELSKLVIRIYKSGYRPVFNIDDYTLTKFIKLKTSPYLSSKDFRTFRANVYAYEAIKNIKLPTNKQEYKEAVNMVADYVSERLNNTREVVKKSYIDPRIFERFLGKESDYDTEKKYFGGIIWR